MVNHDRGQGRESESANDFRNATQGLISSLQSGLHVIEEGVNSPNFSQAACEEGLIEAFRAYSEAYERLTGNNLLQASNMSSSNNSATSKSGGSGGNFISILSRIDYFVEDFEGLVSEGRESYRRMNSATTPGEARSEVSDAADAIYEILHENGDQVPFPFPAGIPISGIIYFLKIDEPMLRDPHDWPSRPFGVAEGEEDDLLFAHRDVFMPSGNPGEQ
ncbi:hypothetical protein ACFOY2_40180 [Nonomuraea purpurea]|uniref:Uncharacterized protein n=1 Tax=Nonomuraea purpurea TaxID=1849276 RepID=A0ABV8GHT2_9ACTN